MSVGIYFSGLYVKIYKIKSGFGQFGCDRELSAHFHSAASLWYQIPDNLPDTIPSHIILTAGRPVLALIRKSECKAGIEPGTSRSRSGHSIY